MKKNLISLPAGIKIIIAIFCFSLFPGVDQTYAQVLKDTATLRLVKKTVDHMYNLQFTAAAENCNSIEKKYPGHPVVFLLRGMLIYWKNYPLMAGTAPGKSFEYQLHSCIEKCESYTPDNEAEFLLANLCARGSLLEYYDGNALSSKVFSLGRTTYRYVRRAFEFSGSFPDFYFFTGLYNYYREAYPDAHPIYKPLFIILPRGDRVKGLNELRTASRDAIFMKAEASSFLSSNYKYFEKDFEDAVNFSKAIYERYSGNTMYLIDYIEDLLLTKKYDEAEKLIVSPASRTNNTFYRNQLIILRGVLNEKKYRDTKAAQQEYSIGAQNILGYSSYGNQYAAYAYFGLSRISSSVNDIHNQRIYRRKALELADFKELNFDK